MKRQPSVAFLRGINVGGHRVKMDRLRELFTELGLRDVATFIASGNVVFSTESRDVHELREQIEAHLEENLGYEVATFLRSPEELAAITVFQPAGGGLREVGPEEDRAPASEASHYVMFVDAPVQKTLRSNLAELDSETDRFHFSEGEVHWILQGKLSESPLFGSVMDRATRGFRTTTRNMNTLRRIAAKVAPSGPS